jgi:hypothetical protein
MRQMMLLCMGLMVLWLSGCASTKPILYPNSHLQSVGKEVAERDIEACRRLAESAGAREGGGGGKMGASCNQHRHGSWRRGGEWCRWRRDFRFGWSWFFDWGCQRRYSGITQRVVFFGKTCATESGLCEFCVPLFAGERL